MSAETAVLGDIKEHKETFDWVLEKQASLRAELMTFYKKDLKEIQTALSSIDEKGTGVDFAKQALADVQKFFLEQWMRSYNLVTPDRNTSCESKRNGTAD